MKCDYEYQSNPDCCRSCLLIYCVVVVSAKCRDVWSLIRVSPNDDDIPHQLFDVSNHLSVQSLVPCVTGTPRRRRFRLYGRRPQHPPSLPFRASSWSRSHWKWMGLTGRRMPLHWAPRGSVLLVAVADSHALPSTNPFIKRIPPVAVDGHIPSNWQLSFSLFICQWLSPRISRLLHE